MYKHISFWIFALCFLLGVHYPAVEAQAGKPIPSGKDVTTNQKWLEEVLAYRMKEYGIYQKLTKDSPAAQQKVISFFEGCFKKSYQQPNAPSWEDLEKQGDELLASGENDPLFRSLLGAVKIKSGKVAEGLKIAKASYDDISSSEYPMGMKFSACMRCRPPKPQNQEELELFNANIKDTLRLAVDFLQEIADQPQAQIYAWPDVGPFIEQNCSCNPGQFKIVKEYFEAVEKAEKIHPWTKNMIEGCYYQALAWQLRGGGYANTVTEEGWRGFKENIEKASAHFTKAWELNPKAPYAAAWMIDIVNSGAESKLSPRDWFDRAVRARMDFEPAYRAMLNHLRPRWHGSHQEIYQFGLECLKTKRFDTVVPFQLIPMLLEIDKECGGRGDIWQEEGVYENAKLILEGMEKAAEDSPKDFHGTTLEWILSSHAVIAAKAEQYAEARTIFDRLGMKLDKKAFYYIHGHFPIDGSRVYALTGDARNDVRKFEGIVTTENLSDLTVLKSAREALDKAAAATKEPQARMYFKHWKTRLDWQEQFEKGEWVELTFDPNFSMWDLKNGNWFYESPQSAIAGKFVSGEHAIQCLVPFHGPLEIDVDVVNLDRDLIYRSAIKLCGDSAEDKKNDCLFVSCSETSGYAVTLPNLKQNRSQIMDTSIANHLRIQAWDEAYLFYVDNLEFPPLPMPGMKLGSHLELISYGSQGPLGKTRFSNLRVHKLTLPLPPMEEGAKRIEYFDRLIADHPNDGFPYFQRALVRIPNNRWEGVMPQQWQQAEADLKKALSLTADLYQAHLALNMVYRFQGNIPAALEEAEKYLKVKPDDAKANYLKAWIMATAHDEKLRNGKFAVELAQKACEAAHYKRAAFITALAAAYAEAGNFDEAVKWQTKAVELAQESQKSQESQLLELYKTKQPYHDPE